MLEFSVHVSVCNICVFRSNSELSKPEEVVKSTGESL